MSLAACRSRRVARGVSLGANELYELNILFSAYAQAMLAQEFVVLYSTATAVDPNEMTSLEAGVDAVLANASSSVRSNSDPGATCYDPTMTVTVSRISKPIIVGEERQQVNSNVTRESCHFRKIVAYGCCQIRLYYCDSFDCGMTDFKLLSFFGL